MLGLVLDLALVWLLGLMAVAAVALARSGDTARRLVIADTTVILLVSALVVLAVRRQEGYFLDAALALSLISFVGSIVIASYAVSEGGE